MFVTKIAGANECTSLHKVKGNNRYIFLISFDMKVCCVFSFESPHRSDSIDYTQYTIFSIKKKITLNYPETSAIEIFQRDLRTSSKQPW